MAVANRVVLLLLLLAIVVLAVLAAVELVLVGLDRPALLVSPGEVEDAIRQATWQEPTVRLVAAVAGLAGLLLVVAQAKPRWPDAVETEPIAEGRHIVLDRHGMEGKVQRRVVAHDDVVAANVRWRRFRLRVRCDLYPDAGSRAVAARVGQLVEEELDRQNVRRPPRVTVRTRKSKARTR